MKVIAWNCHGLGNPSAVRSLLELQRAEDPDILFLSETKLREKEIEFLRWRWSLVHMVVQDCDGRCGGLALFWRRGVEVNLRSKGRCHIDAEVVAEDGVKWRLTRIYGESKAGEKENTWRLLRTLHGQTDLPWLCLGDFNEILFVREKEGGPARAQGCMDAFRRALEACELNDLGYVGDPFTWRNNWRDAAGYTRERLDRAVANVGWRCLFPLYKIIKGDPRHSDHRPVIAELNGQTIVFCESRVSCCCCQTNLLISALLLLLDLARDRVTPHTRCLFLFCRVQRSLAQSVSSFVPARTAAAARVSHPTGPATPRSTPCSSVW